MYLCPIFSNVLRLLGKLRPGLSAGQTSNQIVVPTVCNHPFSFTNAKHQSDSFEILGHFFTSLAPKFSCSLFHSQRHFSVTASGLNYFYFFKLDRFILLWTEQQILFPDLKGGCIISYYMLHST